MERKMKVATKEAPWVEFVKSGDLNRAYAEFQKTQRRRIIRDSRAMQFLTAWLFAPLVVVAVRALPVSTDDTAIDLSEEYLLFWKRPNCVGFRLCTKTLLYIAKHRALPLRAVAWLAHWLLFQGQ